MLNEIFSLKLKLTLRFIVVKCFLFHYRKNCSKSSQNLKKNFNGFPLIDIHQTQVWPSGMKSDESRVIGNRCKGWFWVGVVIRSAERYDPEKIGIGRSRNIDAAYDSIAYDRVKTVFFLVSDCTRRAWELASWLVGSCASACDSDNPVLTGS